MRIWRIPSITIAFAGFAAVCVAAVGPETLGRVQEFIIKGDVAEIRSMVEADPTLVNFYNMFGWTPLHHAVFNGRENAVEICSVLLKAGADPNAKDSEGNTPFHFSVYRLGREKLPDETYKGIISLLLINNADVGARNNMGATPLHLAVMRGADPFAVELLIASNADVNAKTTRGGEWTPLHGAAAAGRTDIVEVLLKNKADVNLRDGRGLTPLKVAEQQGRAKIVDMLRQHGATE